MKKHACDVCGCIQECVVMRLCTRIGSERSTGAQSLCIFCVDHALDVWFRKHPDQDIKKHLMTPHELARLYKASGLTSIATNLLKDFDDAA